MVKRISKTGTSYYAQTPEVRRAAKERKLAGLPPKTTRKFQTGDRVIIGKITPYDSYKSHREVPGTILDYHLRRFRYGRGVAGSKYLVDFDDGVKIWIETEFLKKI